MGGCHSWKAAASQSGRLGKYHQSKALMHSSSNEKDQKKQPARPTQLEIWAYMALQGHYCTSSAKDGLVSISDLHTDILSNHLFLYLDTFDVWKLRLTCSKMHELCWDYFEKACPSLSLTSNEGSRQPGKTLCVGFGAGVNILQVANCKHLQELRITGKCNETEERNYCRTQNVSATQT